RRLARERPPAHAEARERSVGRDRGHDPQSLARAREVPQGERGRQPGPELMQVRPASTRGRSNAPAWLETWHSFSFADWHDARYMGFGPLRVLNDDTVAPGMGFGKHPHRDMEILSYVLSGALEHQDSTGTHGIIRPGEVQFMRAGRGVVHGEMNASKTESVHFLQVWIVPDHPGLEPLYDQRKLVFEQGWAKIAG